MELTTDENENRWTGKLMMPDKSTSENSEDEFANGNSEDNCPII